MHHHRWFPAAVLAAVCVLLSTAPGSARLLEVKQDGTKEYSVLQDALSAAATGDTILIHPGNYQNWTERYHGGTFRRAVGFIESGVTIMAETWAAKIIPPDVRDGVGLYSVTSQTVAVEGVRVMGTPRAIGLFFAAGGDTRIRDCLLTETQYGIVCGGPAGTTYVDSTTFVNTGGVVCATSGTAQVFECEFSNNSARNVTAIVAATGGAIEVVGCTVTNAEIVEANTGGRAMVRLVSGRGGRGGALVRDPGSAMELADVSMVGGSDEESGAIGIEVANHGDFRGERVRVANYSWGFLLENAAAVQVHGSHIVEWSDWAVNVTYAAAPPTRDWDFTGNWWGTTDSTAIAEAIWDGHDDPAGSPYGLIEFWPAATQRVPLQQRSVGRMKGFYKHEE